MVGVHLLQSGHRRFVCSSSTATIEASGDETVCFFGKFLKRSHVLVRLRLITGKRLRTHQRRHSQWNALRFVSPRFLSFIPRPKWDSTCINTPFLGASLSAVKLNRERPLPTGPNDHSRGT
jgi:hypothetical protein